MLCIGWFVCLCVMMMMMITNTYCLHIVVPDDSSGCICIFLSLFFFPTYILTEYLNFLVTECILCVSPCVVWVRGVSGDWSSDVIYLLKEVSQSFLIFSKSYLWKILRHVCSFQTLDFNTFWRVWRIFKEMPTLLLQKVAPTFFFNNRQEY